MVNTHLDYVQDGPNRLNRGASVADVVATEKRGPALDDPDAAPVREAPAGAGLAGAPDRRSQRAVAPGLDGADRLPARGRRRRRLAGQRGAGVGGPARLLPRGAPRPGHRPRQHLGRRRRQQGHHRAASTMRTSGGRSTWSAARSSASEGGSGVDRGYPKWTSDHRAVLSQLSVTPVPIPTTVAPVEPHGDPRRRRHGRTTGCPSGADSGRVTLSGPSSASYDVTGSSGSVRGAHGRSGAGELPRRPPRPGRHVVAGNRLTVRPHHAQVHLTTDAHTYRVGTPITVRWTDGPANRWDWVGVYRAGADNPQKDGYLVWGYTGGHDAGALPPSTHGRLVLGRDAPGRALAPTAGALRRPLPAHRPVRQRRLDHLRRPLTRRPAYVLSRRRGATGRPRGCPQGRPGGRCRGAAGGAPPPWTAARAAPRAGAGSRGSDTDGIAPPR